MKKNDQINKRASGRKRTAGSLHPAGSVSPSEHAELYASIHTLGTYLRVGCMGSVAAEARRLARKASKLEKRKWAAVTPND